MVAVPQKRLVLVVFFLLCFISITAKASRSVPKDQSRNGGADHKGDGNETFSPKAKGEVSEGNIDQDLATMDYTPAQKRPPIHN